MQSILHISLIITFTVQVTNTLSKKIANRVQTNWLELVEKGAYHIDDLSEMLMFQLFVALFQIADDDSSGMVSYDELDQVVSAKLFAK